MYIIDRNQWSQMAEQMKLRRSFLVNLSHTEQVIFFFGGGAVIFSDSKSYSMASVFWLPDFFFFFFFVKQNHASLTVFETLF